MTKSESTIPQKRASRRNQSTAVLPRAHVVGAIFRRDFLGYFSSPAGYVFITLFVLASSWIAFGLPEFFANNLANLSTLNRWMPYLLLFLIPAITMTIWAEERKLGTDELLLTLPARDLEVVMGKYLAALGIYTVAILFSLTHVIVLCFLGRPDAGVMFANYLGYWLMGGMFIAFGMVASMMSSSATVAFILGALLCAIPVFAELVGSFLSTLPWIGPVLGKWVQSASVPAQFRDFGVGVIRWSHVLYFVSLTVAMLYLNMVLLGRRHWAGGQRRVARWSHFVMRFAALIVGLASLTALVAHAGPRVDVSAEGLNTLSPASQALIRQIPADRPVFIQAYYSPEVPKEYVKTKLDLLNLLNEIQAVGGDRVQLNLIETERFSEQAREAESRFGIRPRRVPTEEEAQQTSKEIFLGVAFTSGPQELVVPFIERGLPVEYELVRSIRVVSGAERKKVGIVETDARLLGGFDFRGMNQNTEWEIVTELKKQYDVSSVTADTPFSNDFDALVVAQPSSLTQPQIDNLTAYVRGGGPVLLFLDPLPYFDPSLAPLEPKMPPGGPFGGGPPPEPKGDLSELLSLLEIEWPPDQVVWNSYNPHPVLADVPPEYVFVGDGSEAPGGAFGDDPASSGLQEVVLLFAGLFRGQGGANDFTPLLRTNDSGGVLGHNEIVSQSFLGSTLNSNRPYFPSGTPYTLAARVQGPQAKSAGGDATTPAARPISAVLIGDLDLISDGFFELRRKPSESFDFLDFDNVTFVLNCVDELVGDDSFIDLRKRRPEHRTLQAVERQSRQYVEESAAASKRAEDQAKDQLAKAQADLDTKVQAVDERQDLDPRTKEIMASQIERVERRRLAVKKAAIEADRDLAKQEATASKEERVRGIQGWIKAAAILLPPLPALLLGSIVFLHRANRENRGTAPSRLA